MRIRCSGVLRLAGLEDATRVARDRQMLPVRDAGLGACHCYADVVGLIWVALCAATAARVLERVLETYARC